MSRPFNKRFSMDAIRRSAGRRGKRPTRSLSAPAKKEVTKIAERRVALDKEKKHLQSVFTHTPTWNATITGISQVPIGTTVNQRVGDQIKGVKLELDYTLVCSNATVARVIVFKWHPDDNINAPLAGNILSATGGVYALSSNYVFSRRKQFTILADQYVEPVAYDSIDTGLKCKKMTLAGQSIKGKIEFTTTGGKGFEHIYVMSVGQLLAGTSVINYVANYFYSDA